MTSIEDFLKSKNIAFITHEHPAVFTCEEADEHCKNIPGIPGKNLVLKGKKSGRYFLVVLPAAKRADLKKISEIVKDKHITFAGPEILLKYLNVTPGSVSPFGLIYDENHEMEVYIDKEIYDAKTVNFHPNRNTASLELSNEMFHKFLEKIENKIEIIELPPTYSQ